MKDMRLVTSVWDVSGKRSSKQRPSAQIIKTCSGHRPTVNECV